MPYKKYDPKVDELREGMRVRLAGREGVIFGLHLDTTITYIVWGNDDNVTIRLDKFPDVEIFVQPLTIPKNTLDALMTIIGGVGVSTFGCEPCKRHMEFKKKLIDTVSALEVTND